MLQHYCLTPWGFRGQWCNRWEGATILLHIYLFIYLFFCFSLFENHWNFFWVYQNGNFNWEKAKITPGKIRKSDFTPEKNREKWPLHMRVKWYGWNAGMHTEAHYYGTTILILDQAWEQLQVLPEHSKHESVVWKTEIRFKKHLACSQHLWNLEIYHTQTEENVFWKCCEYLK